MALQARGAPAAPNPPVLPQAFFHINVGDVQMPIFIGADDAPPVHHQAAGANAPPVEHIILGNTASNVMEWKYAKLSADAHLLHKYGPLNYWPYGAPTTKETPDLAKPVTFNVRRDLPDNPPQGNFDQMIFMDIKAFRPLLCDSPAYGWALYTHHLVGLEHLNFFPNHAQTGFLSRMLDFPKIFEAELSASGEPVYRPSLLGRLPHNLNQPTGVKFGMHPLTFTFIGFIHIPPAHASNVNPNALTFELVPMAADGWNTPFTDEYAHRHGSRFAIFNKEKAFPQGKFLNKNFMIPGTVFGRPTSPLRAQLHHMVSAFHLAKRELGHVNRPNIGENTLQSVPEKSWCPIVLTDVHFTYNMYEERMVVALKMSRDGQRNATDSTQIYIPVYHKNLVGVQPAQAQFASVEAMAQLPAPLVLD